MLSKLNCELKMHSYMNWMVDVSQQPHTHTQKPTVDTWNLQRKESKHTTAENYQITKEESKKGQKEKRNCKITRKIINKWQQSVYIYQLFNVNKQNSLIEKTEFKSINSSRLSFLYSPTLTSIHDYWKIIGLTRWTFTLAK